MTGSPIRTAERVECPICKSMYLPDYSRISGCSQYCIDLIRHKQKLGATGISARPQRWKAKR